MNSEDDSAQSGGVRAVSTQRVLLVDDVPANNQLLRAYLQSLDCDVSSAGSGEEALEAAFQSPPDLVLLDAQMPGMDGFEVCRRLKASAVCRLTPVVMVTSLTAVEDRVKALEAGADDFLSKPVDRVELVTRAQTLLRLKATYDRLEDSQQVILTLARTVEAKDKYTEAHTARVAASSEALARCAGLKGADLESIAFGAAVHDIGKLGIPDAVLLKPGPLTVDEWLIMRQHPLIGAEIVRPLRNAGALSAIIRHHHERVDGTGYPDRLRGKEIPLTARIVAICDGYDAMVSDRPYRRGRSRQEAVDVLRDGAGTHWDADLVDEFIGSVLDRRRLRAV